MKPEQSAAVKQFLAEVVDLGKKHGLSLSHEDEHGAFVVEKFSDYNAGWLKDAYDKTGVK